MLLRSSLRRFAALACPVALFVSAPPAGAQAPPETVAEELVVVESSILLQRGERAKPENLAVAVDGAVAEAVAVYPLKEVEFPTTLFFDLCSTSFERLIDAVGMVAGVADTLIELGPVSVHVAGSDSRRVLDASRDEPSLAAALGVVLRLPRGGCSGSSPEDEVARLRTVFENSDRKGTPSLLVLYGLDHTRLTADDLEQYRPTFDRLGRELAGAGYTPIVLLPDESDEPLEEADVRSLVGGPDEPPRVINLGAIAGFIAARRQIVANDPRLLIVATDPRNDLAREAVAPGRGRLFAFPRPFEAFVLGLADYQVLYYRTRLREAARRNQLAPIEVRLVRSGTAVETARVTRLRGQTP